MRFPSYESCEAPQEDLLSAYARFFSEYERDHTEYIKKHGGRTTDNLIAIAKQIGNGCFRLGKGDEKGARRQFQVAAEPLRNTTHSLSHNRNYQHTQALLLGHTLNMLRFRKSESLVEKERKAMHDTVVSELQLNVKRANHFFRSPKKPTAREVSQQDRRVGTINELTSLGLVTRYAHPWALGMQALPHHDQSDDAVESYDNLLVEALPDQTASFYRLQLKTECIGACNEPAKRRSRPNGRYVPDIRIISAHCDLAYDRNNPISENYFPLGSLLIKEAVGKPNPEEVHTLDIASDRLLFAITSDESRCGTATYR